MQIRPQSLTVLVVAIGLATIVSCSSEKEKPMRETENESLSQQLEEIAQGAKERYPEEVLKKFADGIAAVRATGIETSAKQVGNEAIDAELKGWDGETVRLSELWNQGPVVLMWYRGSWCPYCNLQLRTMQQQLLKIEGGGARLLVLTPELPEKAKQMAEENDIELVALHDQNNELARQYGIVFQLPEIIVPIYRDKLKLAEYNGNDKMELPLAATYVINNSGKITYAFLDADYTKRAEPKDVIAAVKNAEASE